VKYFLKYANPTFRMEHRYNAVISLLHLVQKLRVGDDEIFGRVGSLLVPANYDV
jgi:hypothetical protein